jgi:hypothetical protein
MMQDDLFDECLWLSAGYARMEQDIHNHHLPWKAVEAESDIRADWL